MENEPGRQCVIPLHKPSRKELFFFFASGILVSIPFAYFFESLVPAGFSSVLLIVLLAPFIEELAKVFPLFYRHGETERSIVTLGLLIGLGFGVAEFAEYVFVGGASVIGSIPHIIFHASSATITAFGIAKKNPLPYYLFAVTFHMAINFLGLSRDILLGLFGQLLVLIIVYLFAWQYYHRASKVKVVI